MRRNPAGKRYHVRNRACVNLTCPAGGHGLRGHTGWGRSAQFGRILRVSQNLKFLDNPLSSAHWHEMPLGRLQKILWAVFFSTSVAGFVFEMAALVMVQRPLLPIGPFSGLVAAAL